MQTNHPLHISLSLRVLRLCLTLSHSHSLSLTQAWHKSTCFFCVNWLTRSHFALYIFSSFSYMLIRIIKGPNCNVSWHLSTRLWWKLTWIGILLFLMLLLLLLLCFWYFCCCWDTVVFVLFKLGVIFTKKLKYLQTETTEQTGAVFRENWGGWNFFVPDLKKLPYLLCSQGDYINRLKDNPDLKHRQL